MDTSYRECNRRGLTLRLSILAIALSFLVSPGALDCQAAASAGAGSSDFIGEPVIERSRTLLRQLSERGITFQTVFVNDYSIGDNSEGGSPEGFGRYSLDFSANVDGQKAFGLRGATGFVRLKQHINEFGDPYSSTMQGYSNIDAPSRTVLYELWGQKTLFGEKMRIKGGKMDANGEFATVSAASDFLNSSMGFSPTIMGFPTYPEPKPGGNLAFIPHRNYQVNIGFFETVNTRHMTLAEAGRNWNISEQELPGRAAFGYWRLGNLPQSGAISSTQGFYLVGEQSLWRRASTQNAERRLTSFVQVGTGNGSVNPFTRHLGGGIVWDGPFVSRAQDSAGVAATWVEYMPDSETKTRPEAVVEAYYKLKLHSHIDLLPDFQLFHHDDPALSHSNCAVITPRLVITF